MKRLLLGVVFGSLLTLIGLQASHSHASPLSDGCSVCALGQQAQRHAPAAAPQIASLSQACSVPQQAAAAPEAAAASASRARAPPALS